MKIITQPTNDQEVFNFKSQYWILKEVFKDLKKDRREDFDSFSALSLFKSQYERIGEEDSHWESPFKSKWRALPYSDGYYNL